MAERHPRPHQWHVRLQSRHGALEGLRAEEEAMVYVTMFGARDEWFVIPSIVLVVLCCGLLLLLLFGRRGDGGPKDWR